jgi:dihydroxy-acid dehydratase
MFTANTMSSAVEALGMSPPHTASGPAVTTDNQLTNQKRADCGTVAELIFHLLEQKTQTRHIMTRELIVGQ